MSRGQKDFFDSIRRSIKTAYFIGSIIPLALLVFFTSKYIYALFVSTDSGDLPVHIIILLLLAVIVSLLGLTLAIRATNSSIASIKNLHMKLTNLIDTTKVFRTTQYIDVLMESIVKAALRLSSSEAGALLLYDELGSLKYMTVKGKRSDPLKDRVIHKGEGLAGWVAEKGKSVLVNDPQNDERFNPSIDEETGYRTRSLMAAPLIHSSEVIGVLEVVNRREGEYAVDDEKLLHSLADQAALSIAQQRFLDNQKSDIIHITSLLIEAQDHFNMEKKGHARSVANYANMIGKKLNLSTHELKVLYNASLLHDIGFLKIPISDTKNLTPADTEKIMTHPRVGFEMIKNVSIWSESANLVLSHHERYDGKGYPMKKKGDQIPLGARIIFVADVFDVLTGSSSYKKTMDFRSAMNEIAAHAGTQFDPEVVKVFQSAMEESGNL
jgi:HD-GYP domain-containing protein (c-di-GMP phosphodiesterase class II)